MPERKLLNCILVEGIMLIILSLCVIILPKLTALSYGVMLSGAFIAYGIYKIVYSIINKSNKLRMVLCILMGVFLSTLGILILFVPDVSLLWLISLTGVYFVLESISSVVYGLRLRNVYHFWGCKLISAVILFVIGLLIILGVPMMSFWMVTLLSGVGYLIKGMSKLTLALSNL